MYTTLKGLDRRLNELTKANCHTLARVCACRFALENIVKGRTFEGHFDLMMEVYKGIEARSNKNNFLSFEDSLLRRGCDDEFNIYAPKISEAFHEVTKKYI